MKKFVFAFAPFVAVALAAAACADEAQKARREKLNDAMKAAHHGDTSPQARVAAELKKDAPDWAQVGTDAKAFAAVADAMRAADLPYTPPTKYVAAAAALTKAAAAKDKKAATESFVALRKTCAGCHYGRVYREDR